MRTPEHYFDWLDAVYVYAQLLPPDRKVGSDAFVSILVRWGRYATWRSGAEVGGSGFPSVRRLSAETGKSEKTVDRVLKLAAELHLLRRVSRRQGGQHPRPAVYAAVVPGAQSGTLGVPSDGSRDASERNHDALRPEPERSQSGTWRGSERNPGGPMTKDQMTTTTNAQSPAAAPLLNVVEGGGGTFQDNSEDDSLSEVLSELADAGCHIGPRSREDLRPALTQYLAAGWAPAALAHELTKGELPQQVRSPSRLIHHRLGDIPVTPPATRVAPAAGKPWCGRCDVDTHRYIRDADGEPTGEKCTCHPGYTPADLMPALEEIAS